MLWLSLRVACVATVVSLALGMPLAWLLVNRHFPGRRELGALVSAALVLPAPIVCYFLISGDVPQWSWSLTAAAVISALPLPVWVGRHAFAGLDPGYGRVARSLGASDWRIFWRVELPLIWRPAGVAVLLAFVRVLAELAVFFLLVFRVSIRA